MNDHPPFEPLGDASLEARIVAWVLGEATAFEAEELERLCAERPELRVFRQRMRMLHGLMAEAEAETPDEAWKLPEAKRAKIEALFKTAEPEPMVNPVPKRFRPRQLRDALLATAACVALTTGFWYSEKSMGRRDIMASHAVKTVEFLPPIAANEVDERRESSDRFASARPQSVNPLDGPLGGAMGGRQDGDRQRQLQERGEIVWSNSDSPVDRPVPAAKPSTRPSTRLNGGVELSGGSQFALKPEEQAVAKDDDAPSRSSGLRSGNAPIQAKELKSLSEMKPDTARRVVVEGDDEISKLSAADVPLSEPSPMSGAGDAFGNGTRDVAASRARQDQTRAAFLMEADKAWELTAPRNQPTPPATPEPQQAGEKYGDLAKREATSGGVRYKADALDDVRSVARSEFGMDQDGKATAPGDPLMLKAKQNVDAYAPDAAKPAKPGAAEGEATLVSGLVGSLQAKDAELADNNALTDVKGKKAPKGQASAGKLIPQNQDRPAQPRTLPVVVTDEILASRDPFSTFSLHVSDASFKVAKAALDRGEMPVPESIRVEEFYNAFDYGDPAPAAGAPVACKLEQMRHPVLPQRTLVRIAVKTGSNGRVASQPLNLTVLLDSSGSMEREDRRECLNQAMARLASLLNPGDTITLAGFSRTPRLLADRVSGAKAAELVDLVRRTPSEGGTNLEEALRVGAELALRQKQPGAQNRIVLLTDGAANLGNADPAQLAARVREIRQQGVAFDAAGLGSDEVSDRMLEALTRDGNGRYYIVRSPEEANANFAKQLAGAFRPAAENVKVQVKFNPERVGSYKLIGFEKHRLNKEDFRDDTVDAAELAQDEAGVAIYQVETLPEGRGEVGEVSVRFRDAASGQMVEQSWAVPYEPKAPAIDQATPSMQLATLAMLSGEKLRGGPLASAINFQEMAGVIANCKKYYASSKKTAELFEMTDRLR